MHCINTFLFHGKGSITRPGVFSLVRDHFGGNRDVQFEEEELPFDLPPSLRVSFGSYSFSVSYIEDESVRESVEHVQKVTSARLPVENLTGEIRTVFDDDPKNEHDHIAVNMYQFLEELTGAVVYDENHRRIVSSSI